MQHSPIQWALSALKTAGYGNPSPTPDLIQDNAWSTVSRFQTDQGWIYLKQVPPGLFVETEIIQILLQDFQAPVPLLIAENPEQHCFLMHDAGIPLHAYFKPTFKAPVLIEALQAYTRIQQETLTQLDRFLKLSIPDWRLAQLPELYENLIAQEALLMQDGITAEELKKLNALKPTLLSLCEDLSRYALPETFSHCDFHDKNILLNPETGQITLIDLGEVAITHPFFSLLNCLHRAKENFQLPTDLSQSLQEICLKLWLPFETKAHLNHIYALILKCWPIHSLLAEYRLLNSLDPLARQSLSRQGRLANNLRHWLHLADK